MTEFAATTDCASACAMRASISAGPWTLQAVTVAHRQDGIDADDVDRIAEDYKIDRDALGRWLNWAAWRYLRL